MMWTSEWAEEGGRQRNILDLSNFCSGYIKSGFFHTCEHTGIRGSPQIHLLDWFNCTSLFIPHAHELHIQRPTLIFLSRVYRRIRFGSCVREKLSKQLFPTVTGFQYGCIPIFCINEVCWNFAVRMHLHVDVTRQPEADIQSTTYLTYRITIPTLYTARISTDILRKSISVEVSYTQGSS